MLRRFYVVADVIIFVYEVPCIFWHYINVDEVSWITLKKYYKVRWNYYKLRQLSLLQSAMDCYYKLRQHFYYKVRHSLLQIATGITKCDGFITNCDRYYKVRWLLQIATVQVRILFLNEVFGLLSSRNLATTATWRNDFSSLWKWIKHSST